MFTEPVVRHRRYVTGEIALPPKDPSLDTEYGRPSIEYRGDAGTRVG
jgi:hypothetical protein